MMKSFPFAPLIAAATLLYSVWGIGTLQAEDNKPTDLRGHLTKQTHKNDAGDTMPYRLFVPKGYDAKMKYPVILFLHGYGENGTDNDNQLKHADPLRFITDEVQAKHPCLLVAPQNPKGLWPGKSSQLAMEILDSLAKKYSIDADRRYVTGLSSGGMGTYYCLVERPDYFAAGVPICGRGDTSKAELIAEIPVWGFCGDTDSFAAKMRAMNEAVIKAGGNWKYTEYPGVGHNSWGRAYVTGDLPAWLFAQRRGKK
jgi:predicted peptidase